MKFNLKNELLKGSSPQQRTKIVTYIDKNTDRFSALVDLFLQGPYRITQNAANALIGCIKTYPELVLPHIKKMLLHASQKDAHTAIKRNAMRLFQFIDIPQHEQGFVANLCFSFIKNRKEPIAVRVFSLTVLANLSTHFPEIKHELVLLIEDALPFERAAFVSRGKKIVKVLKS